MLKILRKHINKDEMTKGSLIFFILFNMFNMMNFLFHFISGRLLGSALYGTLGAIMGIIYIFNIPADSVITIISRYTTKCLGNENKIKGLFVKSLKKFFFVGIISFLLFALLSPLLGAFLDIEVPLLILTGVLLISVFTITVNRGILQGQKKFSALGLNFFSEGILKLGLTIALIIIGFKVYGAVLGIMIGAGFAFLLSLISLSTILKVEKKEVDTKGIYSYSLPVLVTIAAITIFYSIDLILAKRFFPDDIVGKYAAISMIGKIIFFGTMPISRVMFPLVSERCDIKKDAKDLLKKSLAFVFLLSLAALIVYYFFDNLIIFILYGKDFVDFSKYLIFPSLAMALLSLSNVFAFYNLCSKRKNLNYLLIIFIAIQIILLSVFNSTILQFMYMNILANLLLFVFMFILSLRN